MNKREIMNVNCLNTGREEESNITNINLLIRFNKTREILSGILSVLITAATSPSVERVNSKERGAYWLATCLRNPKAPGSSPVASYGQRWPLCSNKPANV